MSEKPYQATEDGGIEFRSNRRPGDVRIPNYVYDLWLPILGAQALGIYATYCRLEHPGQWKGLSMGRLARAFRVGTSTLTSANALLEDCGFIHIRRPEGIERLKHRSLVLTILDPPAEVPADTLKRLAHPSGYEPLCTWLVQPSETAPEEEIPDRNPECSGFPAFPDRNAGLPSQIRRPSQTGTPLLKSLSVEVPQSCRESAPGFFDHPNGDPDPEPPAPAPSKPSDPEPRTPSPRHTRLQQCEAGIFLYCGQQMRRGQGGVLWAETVLETVQLHERVGRTVSEDDLLLAGKNGRSAWNASERGGAPRFLDCFLEALDVLMNEREAAGKMLTKEERQARTEAEWNEYVRQQREEREREERERPPNLVTPALRDGPGSEAWHAFTGGNAFADETLRKIGRKQGCPWAMAVAEEGAS